MSLCLRFHPVAPFRLDLTVWALRRRAHNAIDQWDGERWRRVLAIRGAAVEVAARQTGSAHDPEVEVEIFGTRSRSAADELAATVRRILGIDIDLAPFYRLAARDVHLSPIVHRLRGMKPPRFPSLFEALANAIACQQVSLTAGMHVLNRLIEKFGCPCAESGRATAYAFPEADAVRYADPATLRTIGFSRQKAQSLIEVADACARQGDYGSDALEGLDNEAVFERLCELRGVGRWSAEYTMLRGLGRLNVFPADDIGGQNKLKTWLKLRGKLNYDKVRQRLSRWHSYQGLVYFHLLVNDLAERGFAASGERYAGASVVSQKT
jgi:DNA-3-methyladenine glycosylase II